MATATLTTTSYDVTNALKALNHWTEAAGDLETKHLASLIETAEDDLKTLAPVIDAAFKVWRKDHAGKSLADFVPTTFNKIMSTQVTAEGGTMVWTFDPKSTDVLDKRSWKAFQVLFNLHRFGHSNTNLVKFTNYSMVNGQFFPRVEAYATWLGNAKLFTDKGVLTASAAKVKADAAAKKVKDAETAASRAAERARVQLTKVDFLSDIKADEAVDIDVELALRVHDLQALLATRLAAGGVEYTAKVTAQVEAAIDKKLIRKGK